MREARQSIETLRQRHRWPVVVIGDKLNNEKHIEWPDIGAPGRWAKVNLNNLSPFQDTLFLDADTRVYGKLDVGFKALERGWDLVMVPSKPQGDEIFHHLTETERAVTLDEVGIPLQLNTGVIWFRKNERTARFFETWREEWLRFKDRDQGALHRALERAPLRVLLLGRAFNGGVVVAHRFGGCRRA